jgi:DNA repair protein RadC
LPFGRRRGRTIGLLHITKAIIDIAGPLGISVHDHIIVGKNGHASLRGMKLI